MMDAQSQFPTPPRKEYVRITTRISMISINGRQKEVESQPTRRRKSSLGFSVFFRARDRTIGQHHRRSRTSNGSREWR